MILIVKAPAPEALLSLRKKAAEKGLSPRQAYHLLNKNANLKNKVRNALIQEQGGLCAYCMCRIPRGDAGNQPAVIIEHFIAREPSDGRDVGQGLDYYNLFAVCHGNRGDAGTRKQIDLTCDAHRGNTEFRKIDPLRAETMAAITYTLEGEIQSEDPDVAFDLVETLNLNCPTAPLVAERKAVLDSLLADIGRVPIEELGPYCANILQSYMDETNPKTPLCGDSSLVFEIAAGGHWKSIKPAAFPEKYHLDNPPAG